MSLTTYILLDTFVLTDIYQTEATAANTEIFAAVQKEDSLESKIDANANKEAKVSEQDEEALSEYGQSAENKETDEDLASIGAVLTQTEYENYSDGNVSVIIKQYTYEGTQVYVADVKLKSVENIKTAFANDAYGRNVTAKTSEIASVNGAILAINGDFYGAQETGYVIRNGKVYRDTADSDDEICCIYADGTMKIMNAGEKSAQELVEEGVWQAFSFGPGLVEGGEIAVTGADEVGKAMASNPRTAIGQVSEDHYVFVVSDGRTRESAGLSLIQLAKFMKGLGVTNAYNLDGGGSSAMYYQGSIINKPTTNGHRISERSVSDIVYVK